MSTQAIIIALVFVVSTIAIILFEIKSRSIRSVHLQYIRSLQSNLHLNQDQLLKRQNNLKQYDLQKHNLDEVLIVQDEIEI